MMSLIKLDTKGTLVGRQPLSAVITANVASGRPLEPTGGDREGFSPSQKKVLANAHIYLRSMM